MAQMQRLRLRTAGGVALVIVAAGTVACAWLAVDEIAHLLLPGA